MNFIVPIVMQALYREADDMRIAIASQVPESRSASLQEMQNEFIANWTEAFNAYTTNMAGNSEDYNPIFSLTQPFFMYFLEY